MLNSSFTIAPFTSPHGWSSIGIQHWELWLQPTHQQKPRVACLACSSYYAACIENTSRNVEECKYCCTIYTWRLLWDRRDGWSWFRGMQELQLTQPSWLHCAGSGTKPGSPSARCHRRDSSQLCKIGKTADVAWVLLSRTQTCHLPWVALGSAERSIPSTIVLHRGNKTTWITNLWLMQSRN